jgi:archaellum component FlaC
MSDEQIKLIVAAAPELFEAEMLKALTDSSWKTEQNLALLKLLRKIVKLTDKEILQQAKRFSEAAKEYSELLRIWKPEPNPDFDPDSINGVEKNLTEAGQTLGKSVEQVFQDWQLLDSTRRQIATLETDVAAERERLKQLMATSYTSDIGIMRTNARETVKDLGQKLSSLKSDIEGVSATLLTFRGMSPEQLLREVNDAEEK